MHVAALALLLTGCATVTGHPATTPAANAPATPATPATTVGPAAAHHGRRRPDVTARLILPTRTMPAGSGITAEVLVSNDTGHAIHIAGCLTLFQALLSSRTDRPTVAWLSCVQRLTIPQGQTRYRIPVKASYDSCSEGRQQGGRRCLPGGDPPPLPPGTYQVRLYQLGHRVQLPPPATVRVTS